MPWTRGSNFVQSAATSTPADWQAVVGNASGIAYIKKIFIVDTGAGTGEFTLEIDGLDVINTRPLAADEIIQLDFGGARGWKCKNLEWEETGAGVAITVFFGEEQGG